MTGLIGSTAVPLLGVPHVFLLPALLCAVCWVAFQGLEHAARRVDGETAPRIVVVP